MVCGNVYAQKNKKTPLLVSGRKDAVPPDFASSTYLKRRSSTSDNGLKRRKLTKKPPLHLRRLTGDRLSASQGLAPTVLSLGKGHESSSRS